MSERRYLPLLAAIALIALGALALRVGPDHQVDLTVLRGRSPFSRYASKQMLIGSGGVTGWGLMVHYRMNDDWKVVGPQIDAELKRLGFVRRFALRSKGGEWERADMVLHAQTHWTRKTGNRLSDVTITRPAVVGEIIRSSIKERLGR